MPNLLIVWAALLGTTGVYALVLSMVTVPSSSVVLDPPLLMAMEVVALALGLASLVVGRALHAAAVRRLDAGEVTLDEQPDPAGPGVHFRDAGPRQRLVRDPSTARKVAVKLYSPTLVISCALSESVSIMGLMVGMLGGPRGTAYGLIAVGTLLVASQAPTADRVFGPVERKLGVSLRDWSPPR